MKRIVVIGDTLRDVYMHYRTKRICHGVPVAEYSHVERQPGGAAATAAMCHALGASVLFLTSRNVSVKLRYVLDGKILFRDDHDSLGSAKEVLGQIDQVQADDLVIVSDYGKGDINQEVLEQAFARTKQVLVDPYPGVHPDRYLPYWFICPNYEAFRQFPKEFQRNGGLCVKLGEHGAALADPCGLVVPALPVDDADPCGAGDQWMAAFAVALASGASLVEAVRQATNTASLGCAKRGATPVTAEEVSSKLARPGS